MIKRVGIERIEHVDGTNESVEFARRISQVPTSNTDPGIESDPVTEADSNIHGGSLKRQFGYFRHFRRPAELSSHHFSLALSYVPKCFAKMHPTEAGI
jgi:hypothetical protein